MKLAIINQKGGVGKTTTSVNLAYALALLKKKTLLIDMDPQAHACAIYSPAPVKEEPTIMDVLLDRKFDIRKAIRPAFVSGREVDNLFLIPSNIHLELGEKKLDLKPHREKILHNQLGKIRKSFDYIVIDCPPRLNQLTVNAIYAADLLLIPTVLDRYSLDGIADLFDTIEEVKEEEKARFLILKNAYDMREKISNEIAETVLKNFEDSICQVTIRRTSTMKQSQQYNQPIFTYDHKSPICDDYIALSKVIIEYAKK